MITEKRKTVYELVVDLKDWTMAHSLTHKNFAEKQSVLESVFCLAIKAKDDQATLKCVTWMLALSDDHILDVQKYQEWVALAARRKQAIELFARMPIDGVNKDKFLETKKFLLTEISERWKLTKDEEEANKILMFFAGLRFDNRHYEEKKMLLGVLFEAMKGFPAQRLEEHLITIATAIASKDSDKIRFIDGDIIDILRKAWARNIDFCDLGRKLIAIGPLMTCPPEAYVLAKKTSGQTAKIFEDVKQFMIMLEAKEDYKRVWDYEAIPYGQQQYVPVGRIYITFPELNRIGLRFEISPFTFRESDCSNWFEVFKNKIMEWQGKNPHDVGMRLEVVNLTRLLHKREVLFSREEEMLVKKN